MNGVKSSKNRRLIKESMETNQVAFTTRTNHTNNINKGLVSLDELSQIPNLTSSLQEKFESFELEFGSSAKISVNKKSPRNRNQSISLKNLLHTILNALYNLFCQLKDNITNSATKLGFVVFVLIGMTYAIISVGYNVTSHNHHGNTEEYSAIPFHFQLSQKQPERLEDLIPQFVELRNQLLKFSELYQSRNNLDKDMQQNIQKMVKQLQVKVEKISNSNAILQKLEKGHSNKIGFIEKELLNLSEKVQILEETKKVQDSIIKKIEKILPDAMIASVNRTTGQIEPTTEFWRFLSRVFGNPPSNWTSIASSYTEGKSPNDAIHDFHEYISKAVESYAQNRSHADDSAIVSKEIFSDILKRELESNTDTILETLRQLRYDSSNNEGYSKSLLDQTVYATLTKIVQRSLERYVFRTISKPNVISQASGSRIIRKLTSLNYNWKNKFPLSRRLLIDFANIFGLGVMRVNDPQIAFSDNLNLGSCWAFHGQSGQLGVSLSRDAVLTDFGIVHISSNRTWLPTSSPRSVSLWISVDDKQLRDQVLKILKYVYQKQNNTFIGGSNKTDIIPFGIDDKYLKILTVEYDAFNGDEFQVFPIPVEIQQLRIPTRLVLFEIESNWGNQEYTCIYQFKLFGNYIDQRSTNIMESKRLDPTVSEIKVSDILENERSQTYQNYRHSDFQAEQTLSENENESQSETESESKPTDTEGEFYYHASELDLPFERGSVFVKSLDSQTIEVTDPNDVF